MCKAIEKSELDRWTDKDTFNLIVSASLDHFPSSTNWKFILLGRRSLVLLIPIVASK